MATATLPPLSQLATVRRFEAAGFRAWPATSIVYEGTWAIRLTASHPAKRLNSINPLDPNDTREIPQRIERASSRFEAYGRPLTFRLSPLGGQHLTSYLDERGWTRFSESLVMRANLAEARLEGAVTHIPLRDTGRFVNASMRMEGADATRRAGLSEVIGAIRPEAGLFILETDGRPVASGICVHDGDLAGLFEIVTDARERGKGLGHQLVMSAMKWAKLRGAREAWLQVEADNAAALSLYRTLGFTELYRYHYRSPSSSAAHG